MSSYEKVAEVRDRLREALEIRNMKPAELAEQSGINKPSISCYLAGKYEPKQTALYNMGRALDVSEMWIAGYDVPMERSKEQKNNDAIADIVTRLRCDTEFFAIVDKLNRMNGEKLKNLSAFLSD